MVRPRGQGAYGVGAKVLALDEGSIRNIPGARVLRKGDFIGVAAESDWDAVRAAPGVQAALVNFRFLAHALWTTSHAVELLAG